MIKSRKMANRYRNCLVLFIGLFLVCELVLFAYTFYMGLFSLCFLIFHIFPIPYFFMFLLFPIPLGSIGYAYYWPRYQTWISGAEGEEKVAKVLSSLKNCHVFNDIVLPEEQTNIDHAVLSPIGIFAIETKNHKGTVKCAGDSWQLEKVGRMGTIYTGKIGNPSKQVKRNAMILRGFILDRVGLRLYVNGIVCLSNNYANYLNVCALSSIFLSNVCANYPKKAPNHGNLKFVTDN